MADVVLDPDDRQFEKRRQQLLGAFEGWLNDQRAPNSQLVASDVELFVNWCATYSTGQISRIDVDELQEFLLEWIPRNVAAPPSVASPLCLSLQLFVAFLDATGRLRGGNAAATTLIAYLADVVDRVRAALDDDSGASRPTDPVAHPTKLSFAYLPPTDEEIAASAAQAPILTTFTRLRDYLGKSGRTLTNTGNLKLADARALVELMETGDVMDRSYTGQQQKTRSSPELRWLSRLVEWAGGTGAVRVDRNRLLPAEPWATLSPLERVQLCWDFVLDVGSLFRLRIEDETRDIVEESVLHWMVRILPIGEQVEFGSIAESTQAIVADATEEWGQDYWTMAASSLRTDVEEILKTLEICGVICWQESQHADDGYHLHRRRSGTITLTPLGRHFVATLAPEIGYQLDTVSDLSGLSGPELIKKLDAPPAAASDVIRHWQSDLPTVERAVMLAQSITAESTANERIVAISLLYELPADAVEPAIRSWLDGPAAGYAIGFLIEHGLATADDSDTAARIGPLVDSLYLLRDTPVDQAEQWRQVIQGGLDPAELLDEMWRHDVPETEVVLESLSEVLPDERVERLARKALFKHRSRKADRSPAEGA